MSSARETCWTLIQGAARGTDAAREDFARRYLPVVRAYLSERWRASYLAGEIDDAIQDVFIECFREDGALGRADPSRGFRPFLFGTVRNVARRMEERSARRAKHKDQDSFHPEQFAHDEERLSVIFDKAWAAEIMREAADHMRAQAAADGDAAGRRVELLALRFQEGLPIREIAERWEVDAARLHHDYARARDEFKQALLDVLAFHQPDASAAARECDQLLEILA